MIGKAVSEIFEYHCNIHVYCPRVGADRPLGSNLLRLINLKSISCKFFPTNDILTLFPVQMHEGPMLTLPENMSRSSQGHDLYKLCRAPVTDASHQVSKSLAYWFWRRRFLKFFFSIYSHGRHLGHVTLTIYINFLSPFPRMLHIKFGFDWPSGFRGEDL